ncbi:MAG: hypothetical protein WCI62_05110, partial [Erysipelotrichaceae bacterium]
KKKIKLLSSRNIIILSLVLFAICAFGGYQYYETTIKPANMYKDAIALLDSQQYAEARETFTKLGDYKDSENYINEISYQEAIELFNNKSFAAAREAFKILGDYKDSKTQDNNLISKYPIVGDLYQGGIIYYILKPGDAGYNLTVPHGLIVSTEDQSTGTYWSFGNNETTLVKGTLTSIGSGKSNTDKIIARYGKNSTYAARIARDYQGGGYTDWYLPSKDELNRLFEATFISENSYWSSTEVNAHNAWVYLFYVNAYWSGASYGKLHGYFFVRAIRSF